MTPETPVDKFAALDSIAGANEDPTLAPLSPLGSGTMMQPGTQQQQQQQQQQFVSSVPTSLQQGEEEDDEEDEFGDFADATPTSAMTKQDEDEDEEDEFGDFADATPSTPSTTSGIDLDSLMMGVTPTVIMQAAETIVTTEEKVIEEPAPFDPFSSLATYAPSPGAALNSGAALSSSAALSDGAPGGAPGAFGVSDSDVSMLPSSLATSLTPAELIAEERFQEALACLDNSEQFNGSKVHTLKAMEGEIQRWCDSDVVLLYSSCFSPFIQDALAWTPGASIEILRTAVSCQRRATTIRDVIQSLNEKDGEYFSLQKSWLLMLSKAGQEFETCVQLLKELKEAQEEGTIVSYATVMSMSKFERYLDGLCEMWMVVQSLQTDMLKSGTDVRNKRIIVVQMFDQMKLSLSAMGRPLQFASSPKDGELQVLRVWSDGSGGVNFAAPCQFCPVSLCTTLSRASSVRCLNLKNQVV